MEVFAEVFPALVSGGKINNEQHDQFKKIFDSYFETKKGQKYRAIVIGIISIIVAAFIILVKLDPATVKGLFDHPALAITLIGVLSLVVSLVVFSSSWILRDSKSQSAMGMDAIQNNLRWVKNTLGEPAFTNLLNGLSSAAKEEIVFPEPVGVLRHKEFRRALTISVALTYFAILGFSITSDTHIANNIDNPITQAFAWVFVAVIAFYFGDKIFENYAKSKGVQITDSDKKTLESTSKEKIKLDKSNLAKATNQPVEKIDYLGWNLIKQSENFVLGEDKDKGKCPSEQSWTATSKDNEFTREPTQEDKEDCIKKTTKPNKPEHDCSGGCVWTEKREWTQWSLFKHENDEKWNLRCYHNVQWECIKKPPQVDPDN